MTTVTRTRFELILQIDIPHPTQTGQGTPTTTTDPEETTSPGSSLLTDAEAAEAADELPPEGSSGAGETKPSGVDGVPPSIETLTFRCVQFNATFAMNRIPLASATLAVGRDARTLKAALVHSRPDALGRMYRARIILNPLGQWSSSARDANDTFLDGKWSKAGPRRIFDGYITGTGYRKSRGTLQISVQMIHWLSDLAFSSMFSNQSHHGNPANLNFAAVASAFSNTGTGAAASFIGGHHYLKKLTSGNIQQDLWAKSLAEVLCEIGQQDMTQLGNPARCGGLDARNDFSLSALSRIEGQFSCRAPNSRNRWHVPLALTGLGGDEGLVASAIANHVGQQSLRSWWSTTIWDNLVNSLAPTFMFHVIPRVETAIIAPFVAGLRNAWPVPIRNEDISRVYLQSYIRRPLRGVAIYGGRDSNTSAQAPGGINASALNGVGGCFMPDINMRGMVLFKRAPAWLAGIPNFVSTPSSSARGRRGAGGAVSPINSATTPMANVADQLPDGSGAQSGTKGQAIAKGVGLHDRMAQYLYMMEMLRGRNGTLAGKFRLDIAPGTTVFVEDIGEQIIASGAAAGLGGAGVDLASPNFYGTVKTVQYGLDAENAQAMTAFELAHIRSATENTDDRTSVESHPLYLNQQYRGAPLVDGYLFDELT